MDATYIVDGGVDATPQDADSTVVRVDDGSLVDDVSVPFGIEGSERSERERSFEEAEQFADAPFEDDELEVKEAVWEVEEIPPAPAMPELDDLAPKSGKDSTPESDPVLESATTDAVMPPEDEDTAEAEPRIEKDEPALGMPEIPEKLQDYPLPDVVATEVKYMKRPEVALSALGEFVKPIVKDEELRFLSYTPDSGRIDVLSDVDLEGLHTEVLDAAWLDKKNLALAGADGRVSIWNVKQQKMVCSFLPYPLNDPVVYVASLEGSIDEEDWRAERLQLLTMSGEQRALRFWEIDGDTAKLLRSINLPKSGGDVLMSIPLVPKPVPTRKTLSFSTVNEHDEEEQDVPEPEEAPMGVVPTGATSDTATPLEEKAPPYANKVDERELPPLEEEAQEYSQPEKAIAAAVIGNELDETDNAKEVVVEPVMESQAFVADEKVAEGAEDESHFLADSMVEENMQEYSMLDDDEGLEKMPVPSTALDGKSDDEESFQTDNEVSGMDESAAAVLESAQADQAALEAEVDVKEEEKEHGTAEAQAQEDTDVATALAVAAGGAVAGGAIATSLSTKEEEEKEADRRKALFTDEAAGTWIKKDVDDQDGLQKDNMTVESTNATDTELSIPVMSEFSDRVESSEPVVADNFSTTLNSFKEREASSDSTAQFAAVASANEAQKKHFMGKTKSGAIGSVEETATSKDAFEAFRTQDAENEAEKALYNRQVDERRAKAAAAAGLTATAVAGTATAAAVATSKDDDTEYVVEEQVVEEEEEEVEVEAEPTAVKEEPLNAVEQSATDTKVIETTPAVVVGATTSAATAAATAAVVAGARKDDEESEDVEMEEYEEEVDMVEGEDGQMEEIEEVIEESVSVILETEDEDGKVITRDIGEVYDTGAEAVKDAEIGTPEDSEEFVPSYGPEDYAPYEYEEDEEEDEEEEDESGEGTQEVVEEEHEVLTEGEEEEHEVITDVEEEEEETTIEVEEEEEETLTDVEEEIVETEILQEVEYMH